MPAALFYEWQVVPGHKGKQPWCVRLPDNQPFAMAALWDRWQPRHDPIAEPRVSCCVITTEANEAMAGIHHRMPVIIAPTDFDEWRDPATPPAAALALLKPYDGPMVTYQVKTWVNSARNDDTTCAEPLLRADGFAEIEVE